MEGADLHPLGPVVQKIGDPRPHLIGRLVREGDGENILGTGGPLGDEIGYLVRQNPGLSAARPGEQAEGRRGRRRLLSASGSGTPGVPIHHAWFFLPGTPLRQGHPLVHVAGQESTV